MSEISADGPVAPVVGYAPGAYDLFHVGHLNILRHAAEHCDVLSGEVLLARSLLPSRQDDLAELIDEVKVALTVPIAGVVSDEVLLLTKGRAPVVPLAERLEIVRSLRFVDDVHAEVVPDKIDTWRQVRFDVIFKGDDWRGTPKGDKLERDFAEVGVRVQYFPYTMHTSSTILRRALAATIAGEPTERSASVV